MPNTVRVIQLKKKLNNIKIIIVKSLSPFPARGKQGMVVLVSAWWWTGQMFWMAKSSNMNENCYRKYIR